ncbi:MAG: HPr family phosphocarrier protein [Peptococcia bacterium]|jgi:phosphocarrier protein HPr
MIIRQVKFMNESGLHARPAAVFVDLASRFKASIFVEKGEHSYNGKSIVSILSAGIGKGDKVNLIIEGEDEELADELLLSLIKNNFSE